MESFFSADIPLFRWIYKLVNAVLLGALCMVCCIPVVTSGAALAALYYTVMKAVRHERGGFLRTYFFAFKANLKKGTVLSLLLLGYTAVVGYGTWISIQLSRASGTFLLLPYVAGAMLLPVLLIFPYIFPVLSRFEYSIGGYLTNCLYMSIRHFPETLLFGVLLYAAYALPGLLCLLVSVPMEKIFRRYMPKPDEDLKPEEIPWYWE